MKKNLIISQISPNAKESHTTPEAMEGLKKILIDTLKDCYTLEDEKSIKRIVDTFYDMIEEPVLHDAVRGFIDKSFSTKTECKQQNNTSGVEDKLTELHELIFENPEFIIWRMELGPEEGTSSHKHPFKKLMVFPYTTQMETFDENGNTETHTWDAGLYELKADDKAYGYINKDKGKLVALVFGFKKCI